MVESRRIPRTPTRQAPDLLGKQSRNYKETFSKNKFEENKGHVKISWDIIMR